MPIYHLLKIEAYLIPEGASVFLEGEIHDIAAFWHLQVPCIFDEESLSFCASVPVCQGAKFRFLFQDSKKETHPIASVSHAQIDQFDGTTLNLFEAGS